MQLLFMLSLNMENTSVLGLLVSSWVEPPDEQFEICRLHVACQLIFCSLLTDTQVIECG
jgi:hypothetical protein